MCLRHWQSCAPSQRRLITMAQLTLHVGARLGLALFLIINSITHSTHPMVVWSWGLHLTCILRLCYASPRPSWSTHIDSCFSGPLTEQAGSAHGWTFLLGVRPPPYLVPHTFLLHLFLHLGSDAGDIPLPCPACHLFPRFLSLPGRTPTRAWSPGDSVLSLGLRLPRPFHECPLPAAGTSGIIAL